MACFRKTFSTISCWRSILKIFLTSVYTAKNLLLYQSICQDHFFNSRVWHNRYKLFDQSTQTQNFTPQYAGQMMSLNLWNSPLVWFQNRCKITLIIKTSIKVHCCQSNWSKIFLNADGLLCYSVRIRYLMLMAHLPWLRSVTVLGLLQNICIVFS